MKLIVLKFGYRTELNDAEKFRILMRGKRIDQGDRLSFP